MATGKKLKILPPKEEILTNGFDLFDSMFKKNDEVIIITEDDEFFWGKLIVCGPDGFTLKRGTSINFFEWKKVRFMSHDGFPVKKLMGTSSDQYIEQAFSPDIATTIRQVLILELETCGNCNILLPKGYPHTLCAECESKLPERRYGGGHPFIIDGVRSFLINVGNDNPAWMGTPYEEAVVMKSKDGAQGMLWELETIFAFE